MLIYFRDMFRPPASTESNLKDDTCFLTILNPVLF